MWPSRSLPHPARGSRGATGQVRPLGAVFLSWILTKTVQQASSPQRWSLIGVVIAGLVLLAAARFILRSPFFQIERESDTPGRREAGALGQPRPRLRSGQQFGRLVPHRVRRALMRLAAFSAPAGISLLHATVADPDERIRRRRVDTGAEPVGRVVRKGRL